MKDVATRARYEPDVATVSVNWKPSRDSSQETSNEKEDEFGRRETWRVLATNNEEDKGGKLIIFELRYNCTSQLAL